MNDDMRFIHNAKHKEGMAGSLKLGISRALKDTSVDATLILLTDQPLIPLNHYKSMLDHMKAKRPSLLATGYYDTIGVPAIYTRQFFQEIMLMDNKGTAKSILMQHKDQLTTMQCDEAGIDVDTDEDYQKLLSQYE